MSFRLHLPDDRRARALLGLAVVAVLALIVGLVLSGDPEREEARRPRVGETPTLAGGDALLIPAIGIDAPLLPIEISRKGVLTPPSDTDAVGWWKRSATPGADRGQTVMTGHTVRDGGGVMGRLAEVSPGDLISVHDDGRVVDYRATRVVTWSKAKVAERAPYLFSQKRKDGRLVLITCTDWEGKDYLSNVIVFARPDGAA